MRIIFLTGTDKAELLESLLNDGRDVSALLLPYRSPREERLARIRELATAHDIPILRPRRTELADVIRDLAPDLLLSAGYPYLLGAEHLGIARYDLNVHPTLLPKYRGPATAWHVIANGEKESGVTVHMIDEGMDTGPIVAQVVVPLTKFDTVRSLMRKTSEAEPHAVAMALELLESGDAVAVPQDETKASTFIELRTSDDSRFDPGRTLADLYDFLRACDPDRFPPFFEIDGQRVGVRLFRLHKPEGEEDLI